MTNKQKSKRNSNYKQRYGITIDEYDIMVNNQNNLCAICHKNETRKDKYNDVQGLVIDHCHETLEVRGLLCFNCNSLLGFANDNVAVLASAIKYLEFSRIEPNDVR